MIPQEVADLDNLFCVPWENWPFWRVGIQLRRILEWSNLPVSVLVRLTQHYVKGTEREAVELDLMPLPLPVLSAEEEVNAACAEWEEADEDSVPPETTERWQILGGESWMFCCVAVLNYLHTGKDVRHRDLGIMHGPASTSQRLALGKLNDYVNLYIHYGPALDMPTYACAWSQVLERIQLSYTGEEVYPAQMMTWDQLEPALPPVGKAARVRLLDLSDGLMRQFLENPQLLLKPKHEGSGMIWGALRRSCRIWDDLG